MAKGMFRICRTRMAGVDAVEADSGHGFSRHTHDQFGIGIIRRGAQRSLSGRGVVEAGAGNVITVNPGEVHDGIPTGDHGRAWTMLYLDPAVVMSALREFDSTSGAGELHHPVLTDGRAATDFLQLYSHLTAGACGQDIAAESLLLVLVRRLITGGATSREAGLPASLRHARQMMDDRPTDNLALADLARASGLSRFQVLRGLTKLTGLTPHAYLMQKRADLARQLICRRLPLAEVAAASGFADQSHMTRLFVSKYGFTPGAYAAAQKAQ